MLEVPLPAPALQPASATNISAAHVSALSRNAAHVTQLLELSMPAHQPAFSVEEEL